VATGVRDYFKMSGDLEAACNALLGILKEKGVYQ
jgi:hypothetical protein